MSYLSSNRSIQDLIKVTSAGVDVADFVEIRSAIIDRYKAVYGQDIDVSTNNSDGIFINDLALIMNNILQAMKNMYANLDVNTATGTYLENICRLSNVSRKQATSSIATLLLTNLSSSPISIVKSSQSDGIVFIDQAGEEWLYDGQTLSIGPNETASIFVKSSQTGQISAPAGWINQALGSPYITVRQESDAILGELEESDQRLRARRAQSVGAAGSTVVESLIGELLSLSSVRDVKVYNNWQNIATNVSGSKVVTKDGQVIDPHSVYIILRRSGVKNLTNDEYSDSDAKIANIIYQKLTPGINALFSTPNGVSIAGVRSVNIDAGIAGQTQTIKWKNALFSTQDVLLTLQVYKSYDANEVAQIVAKSLVNYLNNLPLSTTVSKNELISEVLSADPRFGNRSTFILSSVVIPTTGGEGGFVDIGYLSSNDEYFNYTFEVSLSQPTDENYVNASIRLFANEE